MRKEFYVQYAFKLNDNINTAISVCTSVLYKTEQARRCIVMHADSLSDRFQW